MNYNRFKELSTNKSRLVIGEEARRSDFKARLWRKEE